MGLTRAEAERCGIGHLFPDAKPKGGGKRRPDPAPSAPPAPYPEYPGRWRLEIPGWRPTPDNELKGRLRGHARKRKDVAVITQAAIALGVPRAIGRRRLTLTVRGRYSTFPDDSAFLKSGWDALVRSGLLIDDSRRWLEFVWPPTYERGEKLTVIELEDIPDVPKEDSP